MCVSEQYPGLRHYDITTLGCLAGKMAPPPTVRVGMLKCRSGQMALLLVSAVSWAFAALSLVNPSVIGQKSALSLVNQKWAPHPALPDNASQPGSAETGETCDFQSRKFLEVAMFKNAPILAVRVGLAKWWSGWVPLHLVSAGSWAFFALSLVKPSSVIGQRFRLRIPA